MSRTMNVTPGQARAAAQTAGGPSAPAATGTHIHVNDRPMETDGWRQGRPVEDPNKTKRWGFVAAKPSEFLVHVRRGQVRTRSSGQGAVCFKWPWDSVAVIPTSLQRLSFRADQVTSERVGIEVVGLAVYRIADPLIAYRVLNFSFPERAQEKLEQTLSSMFVGAARRLIANLSVDDCLQKRKTALAEELLREVAPVVGGEGRLEDTTSQGWGVVLDTIEIQEVRVLSEAVFAQMQAPFRAALDRHARQARAEAEKEVAAREAACNRAIEEARIEAALVVAKRQQELALQTADIGREDALRRARTERELKETQMLDSAALATREAEIQLRAREEETLRAVRREELRRIEADATIVSAAVLREAAAAKALVENEERSAIEHRRTAEAALMRLEGEAKAAVAQALALAAQTNAAAQAQLRIAEKLPEIAAAVSSKLGNVNVTTYGGGDGAAFAPVAGAVRAVLDLVRSAAVAPKG